VPAAEADTADALLPLRVRRLLLASPRGYCAGVVRAIEIVERALEKWGPPVYVRKQIVHNAHVVRELEARGAVFVDSEHEIPEGAATVFSAHGVSPRVRAAASARHLRVVDATCPLVAKVHAEARSFAAAGYALLVIGHAGHEEVEGTMGEAPEASMLIETVADAEAVTPSQSQRLVYLMQTTLSVDDTKEIVAVLRRRFPGIIGPPKEDICYATTNRQEAVKRLAQQAQVVLVLGSANSSNSNRLVEVGRASGAPSYLIDDERAIDERWLGNAETVGLTAGASAPETLVDRVCDWFRARGLHRIEQLEGVEEDVTFRLPTELRPTGASRQPQPSSSKGCS
jgi:4-hydroxy-3-methylbut-2-enyl diphosphate reductase